MSLLGENDRTMLLKIGNEGHVFLVFFDSVNDELLGVFYAGTDPEAARVVNPPTLTLEGASVCVLWRQLQPGLRWGGSLIMNQLLMGNGCDDNLVYDVERDEIRIWGDSIRPLKPEARGSDVTDIYPSDATFEREGILYRALEPDFDPVSEETYRRAEGNNVGLAVVQGALETFSSTIEGEGTWAKPYEYMVIVPATLPTRSELVGFINRDPNAQGILTAELVGDNDEAGLFYGARLAGGSTAFDDTDVFPASQVDVVCTYFRRDSRNLGFESAPTAIVTALETSGRWLTVRVRKDIAHPLAWQYSAIRIYVSAYTVESEPASFQYDGTVFAHVPETFKVSSGFASDGYSAFKFALEVPNEDGEYVIAPSLIESGRSLSTATKRPVPATEFVSSYGRIFTRGDRRHPLRLSYTRHREGEALFPETQDVDSYIDLAARAPDDRMTALSTYRGQLIAFTREHAGIVPSNWYEAGVLESSVHSGAMNGRCAVNWTDGRQYFWGGDGNLYEMGQPGDVTDATAAPVSRLMIPKAGDYIQQYADLSRADEAHTAIDYSGKKWWLWIPGRAGAIKAFCYDFTQRELTGPFDHPAYSAVTRISTADTRLVGCDEQDNLFVLDLTNGLNAVQTFDDGGAVTVQPGSAVLSAIGEEDHSGKTVVQTTTGYIIGGALLEWSTGWIYPAEPGALCGWYKLQWNVIPGSGGLVSMTVESDNGESTTFEYGEVFGRRNPHTLPVRFTGNAVRVTMQVATGGGRRFGLRDTTLWYARHKGSL